MPKDTKTLGNNKARACESLGFVHKKRLCQRFDTTSFILHRSQKVTLLSFLYLTIPLFVNIYHFVQANNKLKPNPDHLHMDRRIRPLLR